VLKDNLLKIIIKINKNYVCQVLKLQIYSALCSAKHRCNIVRGSMLLGVDIVNRHSAQG
jgi:5-methylcytosine-specific restriction endonuclease McrBC regulatory subunit McrC